MLIINTHHNQPYGIEWNEIKFVEQMSIQTGCAVHDLLSILPLYNLISPVQSMITQINLISLASHHVSQFLSPVMIRQTKIVSLSLVKVLGAYIHSWTKVFYILCFFVMKHVCVTVSPKCSKSQPRYSCIMSVKLAMIYTAVIVHKHN